MSRSIRNLPLISIVILIYFLIPCRAEGYDWSTNPGDGSTDNPYQISTPEQLMSIGSNADLLDKHFILTNDIDLSGQTYTRAVIASFSGVFDGNSFKIFNLTGSSLFGKIEGVDAVVKNLGVENITSNRGGGGLAGTLSYGLIKNCYTTGTIQGTSYVGGLVGLSYNNGIISDCYNKCDVSGDGETVWQVCYIGGLVGWQSSGQIIRCYNEGTISGGSEVGGLAGSQEGEIYQSYNMGTVIGTGQGYGIGGIAGFQYSGIVKDCYNIGDIEGYSGVGGITGRGGYIQNCYNLGLVSGDWEAGGLSGFDIGSINSFWNLETSGITGTAPRYGRTSEQLKQASTYIGWNNEGPVWVLDEGQDYPHLIWENKSGEFLPTHYLSEYIPGSGDEWDPYRISTAEQLNAIGGFPDEWDKVFFLVNDIDAGPLVQFRRIGTGVIPFSGIFEGNGHVISNFTYITTENELYTGLFGYAENAVIQNLRLEDVNIFSNENGTGGLVGGMLYGVLENCTCSGTVSGEDYVGGLVGGSNASITNCHSRCTVSGNNIVGGFIGNAGSTTINRCSSTGESTGVESVGGFAGQQSDGTIESCYSTGDVHGQSKVGGFAGAQDQGFHDFAATSPVILNCYATGNIFGKDESQYVGGFIGYQCIDNGTASFTYCFSTGSIEVGACSSYTGGLVGYSNEAVANSYWDIQASGYTESYGGKGRTTEQLKCSTNYIGWNNSEEVWILDEGKDYPHLVWENMSGMPLPAIHLSDLIHFDGQVYFISTADQLNAIGLFPSEWNRSFQQVNSIDLSGIPEREFNKIGISDGMAFTGFFNGNGYVISNLSYITPEEINYVGLFGYISEARIENVCLENVNISSDGDCIGGLIGYQDGGTVSHSYFKGNVDGSFYVGGLVGRQHHGMIKACFTTGSCSGDRGAGGLVGLSSGAIHYCYSASDVRGEESLGGLVGNQYYSDDRIYNCYSTGSVTGGSFVGGLVGRHYALTFSSYKSIYKCYSTGKVKGSSSIGGFIGNLRSDAVAACFWDMETSGTHDGVADYHPDPSGVLGKTTVQMQTRSTFTDAGWDLYTIWSMRDGKEYPRLAALNRVPVALVGESQTAFAGMDQRAVVKLNGKGSHDANGDPLEYLWYSETNLIATGAEPNVILPVGEHVINLIVNDGLVDSEPNDVVITVIGPLESKMMFVPQLLNPKSGGNYVMAVLTLPNRVSVKDLDEDEPWRLLPGELEALYTRTVSNRRQQTVFAVFDRDEVIGVLDFAESKSRHGWRRFLPHFQTAEAEVTVYGKLESGQTVYGTDRIRIIHPTQPKNRPGSRAIHAPGQTGAGKEKSR